MNKTTDRLKPFTHLATVCMKIVAHYKVVNNGRSLVVGDYSGFFVGFVNALAGPPHSDDWRNKATYVLSACKEADCSLDDIYRYAVVPALGEERGPDGEQGIATPCRHCRHPAGMHKHCPSCHTYADGFDEVKEVFGFRHPGGGKGIPQPWCRQCRYLKFTKDGK